ncbi:hypothetical protein GUJ93_ZPchr0012g20651 [Zizania palustris]|uniref:Uncharacterized protein n=1 Tax=Zizania palustris TaxID=103762 RepID=A0A8J6BSW5_ZIZPA|nr:hypothetical protein GUJ93_ZPchr0012g20651 [Zizania palustris]
MFANLQNCRITRKPNVFSPPRIIAEDSTTHLVIAETSSATGISSIPLVGPLAENSSPHTIGSWASSAAPSSIPLHHTSCHRRGLHRTSGCHRDLIHRRHLVDSPPSLSCRELLCSSRPSLGPPPARQLTAAFSQLTAEPNAETLAIGKATE